MKTIELNIYKFNELSNEAQEVAIEDYRERQDFWHVWNEAECTIKSFLEQVPMIKTSHRSWLEANLNNVDDNIRELKGLRLSNWLVNNFSFLYKAKFIKSFDEHKNHRMIRNKTAQNTGKKYCFAYSNINTTQDCNLTGCYMDNNFLDPIYKFIAAPDNSTTFDEIIDDCFNSLEEAINNEIEAMQEDEYIKEEIQANGYEFTEDGKRY